MPCKYDDYDWDELPADICKAFETLGYTKAMWDADKEPKAADQYWKKLSKEQQEAATLIGYTQAEWDAED